MSQPARRQRRSRIACEPCRKRKRKCNGDQPCQTCSDFAYDCCYDVNIRKRRNKDLASNYSTPAPAPATNPLVVPVQQSSLSPNEGSSTPMLTVPPYEAVTMESNSGAAFARRLGLMLDPANALEPQLFAWNVGTRQLPGIYPALPLIEAVSHAEMQVLAQVYFDKVAPYYGFISQESCLVAIETRWLRPATLEPYDLVLCGVAILGYLFSSRNAVPAELHLVETVRTTLEQNFFAFSIGVAAGGSGIPSDTLISAWTLRLMYLRLAGSPHAAWMTSCLLLHLIDASGCHLEPTVSPPRTLTQPPSNIDPDTRRRLVAYVQYINTWISYDLGRSPVQLHGAAPYTAPNSIAEREDYNAEMLNLLPVSESLAPHKPADPAQLTSLLAAVLDSTRVQPLSILSQCNLALCILRRLRALGTHADAGAGAAANPASTTANAFTSPPNPTTSTLSSHAALTSRAISLSHTALTCARQLAHSICPWSHVATMPFQVVYTMLVLDTPAATACLREAMDTLREIRDLYDTDVLREAYRAAGILVALQQRKKEGEGRELRGIVEAHLSAGRGGCRAEADILDGAMGLGHQHQHQHQQQEEEEEPQRVELSGSYSGDSVAEMQGLGVDDEDLVQLFGGGGLGFVLF